MAFGVHLNKNRFQEQEEKSMYDFVSEEDDKDYYTIEHEEEGDVLGVVCFTLLVIGFFAFVFHFCPFLVQ
jgi:hypothetical protein